ncbi:hypothetical protein ACN263_29045 [Micromonospora sp. WMMD729]|uniref:hypothetical protein n=1 Tax=Micromonospora sp. WMMD729 TaxID=3404127 RepID=UPI003BF54352
MTNPYPLSEAPAPAPERSGGLLRPLLWLLLLLSAATNAALTTVVGNPWIGSAFGLVAALCAGALIVHHRRHR